MKPPRGYWNLAKWIKKNPAMFSNDDQIKGALIFSFQQFMDGCGKDLSQWVGISIEELTAWEDSRRLELPQPLQRKQSRPRAARN